MMYFISMLLLAITYTTTLISMLLSALFVILAVYCFFAQADPDATIGSLYLAGIFLGTCVLSSIISFICYVYIDIKDHAK